MCMRERSEGFDRRESALTSTGSPAKEKTKREEEREETEVRRRDGAPLLKACREEGWERERRGGRKRGRSKSSPKNRISLGPNSRTHTHTHSHTHTHTRSQG